MAFDPQYKMSIQDINGKYLSAILRTDGTWNITASPALAYLQTLPNGWADTGITWERDTSFMGVYRSGTQNETLQFSNDARAIIKNLFETASVQAFGTLTIYVLDFGATAITYPVFYQSQLDFKTYSDNHQSFLLSIGTLDSGLYTDLHAFGDTKFNVPIWNNTAPAGDPPTWVLNDSEWIWHDGIKLLYNANYVSTATPSNPLLFNTAIPPGRDSSNVIVGYCAGQFGSGSHQGFHTLPILEQYNITQNNGTTTFIGNDILNPMLIQGNQTMDIQASGGVIGHSDVYIGEEVFWGTNNSRPYSLSKYSIKNAVPTGTTFDMFASVTFNIVGNVDEFATADGMSRVNPFLGFVMWEIDTTDHPPITTSGGHAYMDYQTIFKYPLNGNGTWLAASTPGTGGADVTQITAIKVKYDKVYVFGIIYDDESTNGLPAFDALSNLEFAKLEFAILSKYTSGDPTKPVPDAPMFPASAMAGFRLGTLLSKITKNLATTQTDSYGFPVPVSTPYAFRSDFLSDPSLPPVKDCVPYQVIIASAYTAHDLAGQSYVTAGLYQLFDFCKKILGCGMSIERDPITGEQTVLRIEPLNYFFDSSTMILDLGADIAEFTETALTAGLGANLKLGYTKAQTNSDFGVDPFCTELFFNTPLSNFRGVMDFEETGVLTEMYAIEKLRAQQVSQPIGQDIDPANPSDDNQAIAIYCEPSGFTLSDRVFNPTDITPVTVTAFKPQKYPTAQNADPNAATAPYIRGLYYPDTAINVPLSPCRALQRQTGALLHSVLDTMDSQSLVFRNTAVMQYNNTTLALSSIESNLVISSGPGNVTTEFQDVLIGGLPSKLFRPVVYKVKTKYPVNMYRILGNNPNGYIRFLSKNEGGFGYTERKMFLSKATQLGATQAATELTGWALP